MLLAPAAGGDATLPSAPLTRSKLLREWLAVEPLLLRQKIWFLRHGANHEKTTSYGDGHFLAPAAGLEPAT